MYEPDPASTNARADASPKPGSNPHIDALLRQLFARLGDGVNHEPLLVDRAMGYLADARYGLSETELLEVLFSDTDEKKEGYKDYLDKVSAENNHTLPANPTRIPIALWSRLRSDLAPYLTERSAPGGNVLTFYHRQVAERITEQFVDTADNWLPHERLANYFIRTVPSADRLELGSDTVVVANRYWELATNRSVSELPFLLARSGNEAHLQDLLSNLRYIAGRCSFGDIYQLIDDVTLYSDPESSSNLRGFLAKHAHRITRFPRSTYSVAFHEGPEVLRCQALSMKGERSWTKPWLRTTKTASLNRESAASPSFEVSSQFPLGSCPAGGLAVRRGTAVLVKTIGQLMLIDVLTDRTESLTIETRACRVCRVVCDSHGEAVAVFYDDGGLDLFRLSWDSLGNCVSAHSVFTCKCKLPEFERPAAAFVGRRLFVQTTEGSLVCIDTVAQTPSELQTVRRADSDSWELSSISGTDDWIVASFRDAAGTYLITFPSAGQPSLPVLRADLDVSCMSTVDSHHFVVAYTSGLVEVLRYSDCTTPVTSATAEEVPESITNIDGRLVWGGLRKAFYQWRWAESDAAETVDVEDFRRGPTYGLAATGSDSLLCLNATGYYTLRLGRNVVKRSFEVLSFFVMDNQDRTRAIQLRGDGVWLPDGLLNRDLRITGEASRWYTFGRDGLNRILAARMSGEGFAIGANDGEPKDISSIPRDVTAIAGHSGGGFFFVDAESSIYFLSDTRSRCERVGQIRLPGIGRAKVAVWKDLLVWTGICLGPTQDNVDAVVFFRVGKKSGELTCMGHRLFPPAHGAFEGMTCLFDGRCACFWTEGHDTWVRYGTIDAVLQSEETFIKLSAPLGPLAGIRCSCDGMHNFLLNQEGVLFLLATATWRIEAELPTSKPLVVLSADGSDALSSNTPVAVLNGHRDLFRVEFRELKGVQR